MDNEKLGRFNWHPDPAIDFEVEVEALEGIALDRSIGFANPEDATLESRVEKAMQFRVGGDLGAINAKHALRKLDQSLKDKAALSAQAGAGGEASTALTSPETGGVPEGWKLVPIEPTPEMIRAYRGALKKHIDALSPEVRTSGARGHIIRDDTIKATVRYAAMLAAAPAPEGA